MEPASIIDNNGNLRYPILQNTNELTQIQGKKISHTTRDQEEPYTQQQQQKRKRNQYSKVVFKLNIPKNFMLTWFGWGLVRV